jgi:hypothetical protein
MAAMALERIGEPAAVAVPALRAAVRQYRSPYAVAALGAIGPRAREGVPELVSVLEDPTSSDDLAAAAAQALGRIGVGTTEVVLALRAAIRRGVSNAEGALRAVERGAR